MVSDGEKASTSGRCGGRLIQRATAGAAIHSATKGVAANNEWGLPSSTASRTARANKTLALMRLYIPKIFKSTAEFAWAAVTHCSRFFPEIKILTSVRKIASDISHAWYAKRDVYKRQVLKAAVALAVTAKIAGCFVANRKRRGGPDFSGTLVADIDGFAGCVEDVIVRPGSKLVFVAIDGPTETGTGLGNQKTKRRVGDHIDPRLRSSQALVEHEMCIRDRCRR